jgi:hypothetical protein
MEPEFIIEDNVDPQCIRHVHIRCDRKFVVDPATYPADKGAMMLEDGIWHFRAEYAYRGVLDIAYTNEKKKFRSMVVWNLDGYTSLKKALLEARDEYKRLFGRCPQYGFLRAMPVKLENGIELDGMTILEASWMLEKSVAVCGEL